MNMKSSPLDDNHARERLGIHDSPSPIWRNRDTWLQMPMPCLPPMRVLFLMVLSIFVGEICVMFVLHFWPNLPVFPEAMIDATLLIIILSPTFYLFSYRPIIQNIQQRNMIMAELVESEERLHQALQAVNDGLWDWDIVSGEVYYSPNCSMMLGYHPDEIGPDFKSFLSLIHPEDRNHFEQLFNKHLSGDLTEIEIELRLKCHAEVRDWLWVLIRGKVVARTVDGSPLRAVGTNTNIDERKQVEQALLQSEEGVRYLSQQLIKTSEIEKKHLAQELHDDFGQMITAFKMGLELIREEQNDQQPELEFHCKRLLEMGKQMEISLRNICDNLRPSMLDDLGLILTLEWLINQFSLQHPDIMVRIKQPEITMRLPSDIELICYRICQEALHNISKHAAPKNVQLELNINSESLSLSIKDDGCGFNPSRRVHTTHWGIGLLGIHERAAAFGGSAAIESSPGNGTNILVQMPCKAME